VRADEQHPATAPEFYQRLRQGKPGGVTERTERSASSASSAAAAAAAAMDLVGNAPSLMDRSAGSYSVRSSVKALSVHSAGMQTIQSSPPQMRSDGVQTHTAQCAEMGVGSYTLEHTSREPSVEDTAPQVCHFAAPVMRHFCGGRGRWDSLVETHCRRKRAEVE
jgi:hypothetical protein